MDEDGTTSTAATSVEPARRRRVTTLVAWTIVALVIAPSPARARPDTYGVVYRAQILAEKAVAEIEIEVVQSSPLLLELSATLDAPHWFDFEGPGVTTSDGGFKWAVPESGGTLRYTATIDRVRDEIEYDSRCAADWMLTRGEDLFPSMASRTAAGAEARATLEIDVPPRWTVVTSYAKEGSAFIVEDARRRFDQPEGWLIAGRLDRLEDDIAGMHIQMAAPHDHEVRLRDAMVFLRLVLPTLVRSVGVVRDRITIVSADDPMWRGGLSGPGSLYLHADRPFVDDDGSSPLLHEIVHVLTSARNETGADWIVEGIAEWVSLDVLRRSGAIRQSAFEESLARLRERGAKVTAFRGESRGAETARAVGVMADVDAAIRAENEDASLYDVVTELAVDEIAVDRDGFVGLVERSTGVDVSAIVPE
jgi:hypothetical protein